MYSTVIDRHPTVISHQMPQPTTVAVNMQVAKAFAVDSADTLHDTKLNKLENGSYSIPVKIESSSASDPTLSSYETPNFISKKEKLLNKSQATVEMSLDPEVFLKNSFSQDINKFVAELDRSKDKAAKIETCKDFIFHLI